jgi:uncharacterized protein YdaT
MSKKNVHVVPHDGKWAVRTEKSSRVDSLHDTQQQAIVRGIKIAKNNKSELVTHGKDGKIRDSDSYGHDPCPPKDKKH